MVQPVAQIFYEVIGRKGGIFFTVCAYIVLNFTAMTAIQAGSRTIWAYARDEMLPLSRVWYKIDKRTDTPIYSVWLFTICCVLINLIGLGSYTAIAAIFNLTAIALDWSYCIPIICKLLYGKFERGPFHLGWASTAINCWAVLWTMFVTIIYVQPTILPVTSQNVCTHHFFHRLSMGSLFNPPPLQSPQIPDSSQMNYVCVLIVAVALFAVIYWYAAGRYYYIGPRVKAQLIVGVAGDDKEMHDGLVGKEAHVLGGSNGGSSDEKIG